MMVEIKIFLALPLFTFYLLLFRFGPGSLYSESRASACACQTDNCGDCETMIADARILDSDYPGIRIVTCPDEISEILDVVVRRLRYIGHEHGSIAVAKAECYADWLGVSWEQPKLSVHFEDLVVVHDSYLTSAV